MPRLPVTAVSRTTPEAPLQLQYTIVAFHFVYEREEIPHFLLAIMSAPKETTEAPDEEKPFEPKDAIGESLKTAGIMGAAGTLLSAVQNTLTRANIGPWGVFTRTGTTIAVFSALPFCHKAVLQGRI